MSECVAIDAFFVEIIEVGFWKGFLFRPDTHRMHFAAQNALVVK